jgi:hypothetical protein
MATYTAPASYQDGAGYDSGEHYQLQEANNGGYGGMGDDGSAFVSGGHGGPPVASQTSSTSNLFRSEEMALCQLFLQVRTLANCTVHTVLDSVGLLGNVIFDNPF